MANPIDVVEVSVHDLLELESRVSAMSRDFHYYGFGKGQGNAVAALGLVRAMIAAAEGGEPRPSNTSPGFNGIF